MVQGWSGTHKVRDPTSTDFSALAYYTLGLQLLTQNGCLSSSHRAILPTSRKARRAKKVVPSIFRDTPGSCRQLLPLRAHLMATLLSKGGWEM